MQLVDLRVEHLEAPLGVWTSAPRFSWFVSGGGASREACALEGGAPEGVAVELEVCDERSGEIRWQSGRIDALRMPLLKYAGEPLGSLRAYSWRVRAMIDGGWTDWAGSRFETTLLTREEWIAPFVEPAQEPVTADGLRRVEGDWAPPLNTGAPAARLHPVKHVRQEFTLRAVPTRARLLITAQGVFDAEINGAAVGDELLAPGYDSYDHSLPYQVHDVTALLTGGANALGVRLADGWFAGRIDFTGSSAQYGDRLRTGWQLHIDYTDGDEILVPTDAAVSTTDGPIRYSDIFIGEHHDARRELAGWSSPGFDDSAWASVALASAPAELVPFVGEPVRRTQEIPAVQVVRTPAGDDVVDFGQVIAGRVRMRVRGEAGSEIVLEHSETLDADGNFFMNISGINKDQTDAYVLAGRPEGETWEPAFTFHGFRYVRITGSTQGMTAADFTAVVIGSDLRVTGGFRCSDPALTRLHENVVWSQRSNFLSIPTDCPQRERVGWTGDLQVFAPSATRNMDVRLFLERWLTTLRIDQAPDGLVPVISPASPYMTSLSDDLDDDPLLSIRAAAGWGDAMVLVPWVLYERYGDRQILEQNYAAMRAWVERQIRVAESELPPRLAGHELTARERQRQRLLWNSEKNFGDWLAPSVKAAEPTLEHMLEVAETTGEIIAAMFHFRSSQVLAEAAAALGRTEDQQRYRTRAEAVRAAFAEEYIDEQGRLWSGNQGTYVLALAFGLIPDAWRRSAVDRLVALIHEADTHLDTGFLSVPYLLDVLWDNGEQELARRILWQRSAPSWLYAVDRGATTIWEEWAAIEPDGTVLPTSFNHYAFGCVDDWLFRRVVGIEPAAPGYAGVTIQPDFAPELTWVEGWQDTPHGRIDVSWHRDDTDPAAVELTVRLPFGASGRVTLPSSQGPRIEELGAGETSYRFMQGEMQ